MNTHTSVFVRLRKEHKHRSVLVFDRERRRNTVNWIRSIKFFFFFSFAVVGLLADDDDDESSIIAVGTCVNGH